MLAGGVLLVLMTSGAGRRGPAEYTGSLLLTLVGLMITGVGQRTGADVPGTGTDFHSHLHPALPGTRRAADQEATAKYFYLSILSSALLLYGFSFLYGTTGSTDLQTIRAALAGRPPGRRWATWPRWRCC